MRPVWRLLVLGGACAVLLVGCGGGSSSSTTGSGTTSSAARSAWAAQTQQLCREKRAALAGLGRVHITFGGIARVGLPAVKRSLHRYLTRLGGILRTFSVRQGQIAAPVDVRPAMAQAHAIDRQTQAATVRLRRQVARVRTAAELSQAFRGWLAELQGLTARGDALVARLNLPACRAASSP